MGGDFVSGRVRINGGQIERGEFAKGRVDWHPNREQLFSILVRHYFKWEINSLYLSGKFFHCKLLVYQFDNFTEISTCTWSSNKFYGHGYQ